MKTLSFLADLFGCLALFSGFFVFAFKKRSHILICKAASDLLWMINYFFQGKYSAAGLSFVCFCRGVVFYNNHKFGRILKIFLLCFFLILMTAVSVFPIIIGKDEIIAVLPAIGSFIAVIAFYQSNALNVRRLGILSSLPWFIYALLIGNIFSAVNSAIQMSIGIFMLIRDRNTH